MPDIPASPSAAVQPGHGRSGTTAPASFLRRLGPQILALIPLVMLVCMVAQFAVDVPYQDQWDLVPLLEKTYHGRLTFHDLWAQHNEHRIFFPRIIMLILARCTGWNIRYELAVNLILALGIFAVLICQVQKTGRSLGVAGLRWAVPAGSLIVFSISQYQNWLWGWQLQMFLNLLAVLGGIVLLAGEPFRWGKFAAAALLGLVATFSFANGALFWPIGLLILSVVTAGTREKWTAPAGWMLIGAVTMGAYFHHYQKPEDLPPLDLIFKMPLEYAAYGFKYVGGICFHDLGDGFFGFGVWPFVFGLAGTVAFGWAGVMLVRRKIVSARALLPYFGMGLYSVGSAFVTGLGRLGLGTNQALASRYCTMVVPLWTGLIVLLILLAGGQPAADAGSGELNSPRRSRPRGCQIAARGLLLAAILSLTLGSVFAIADAAGLSRRQAYGRAFLLDLAANPSPGRANATPGLSAVYVRSKIYVVVERYPILMQHRLSLFRDRQAPAAPPSP